MSYQTAYKGAAQVIFAAHMPAINCSFRVHEKFIAIIAAS